MDEHSRTAGSCPREFPSGIETGTHGNQGELPKTTQQVSGGAKDPHLLHPPIGSLSFPLV